jgi:hypothetical protein
MRIDTTSSKTNNVEGQESPEGKLAKNKTILKEKLAPVKNRFGLKLHYYYPRAERIRL